MRLPDILLGAAMAASLFTGLSYLAKHSIAPATGTISATDYFGDHLKVAPKPEVRAVWHPETQTSTYIYADLKEAREVASYYECTDIIGVPDGYELEILFPEECGR